MIVFDYAFNAAKGDEGDDAMPDKTLGTSLVMYDRNSGFTYGNALGSKEADLHSVNEIQKFVKQMGYSRVHIRCDNEPAAVSLQKQLLDVRSAKDEATTISNGKTRDSKSMGAAEVTIRWWRSKLRALRYSVEMAYGIKLTPDSLLWSWLARHSAWVTSRYRLRADGTTAFFGAFGHNYTGEVLPFGETVLMKAPQSSSGARRGQARQNKADTAWIKGIWVGKTDNNDEHIVLTDTGKFTCRTVRRLEPAHRYNIGTPLVPTFLPAHVENWYLHQG